MSLQFPCQDSSIWNYEIILNKCKLFGNVDSWDKGYYLFSSANSNKNKLNIIYSIYTIVILLITCILKEASLSA